MTAGTGRPADPEHFGPYRLDELIGEGGMGEVWRAFDTRRERSVALKRLSRAWMADAELDARFRQEARATARLTSAHVIPIHDFGEVDGRLFVDMRLVPGADLAEAIRRTNAGGLLPARAVEIVTQVADALASAHAAGMVHRDVKPSNIVLASGPREFCYLVDFGIAKVAAQTAAKPVTRTGTVLGTPAYMAPELFTGAAEAGVPSDVYALGCVLYEMLTGSRPFPGIELAVIMHHHISTPPPVPSDTRPGLAPFDTVVARALAKEPSERYATIDDLAVAARAADSEVREPASAQPSRSGGGTCHAGCESHGPEPAGRPESAGGPGGACGPESARPTYRGPVPAVDAPPVSGPRADHGPHDPRTVRVGPESPAPAPSRRRPRVIGGVAAVVLVVAAIVAAVLLTPQGTSGRVATGAPPPTRPSPTVPPGPPRTYPVVPAGMENASSGVALSPDGRRLYAAEPGNEQGPGHLLDVANVDPATGEVTQVATVPVGSGPQQIAVSPDGSKAYVANSGNSTAPGNTISVVDTRSLITVATVTVGPKAIGVSVSPDGSRVWAVAPGYDEAGTSVYVIDAVTNTVIATPTVGPGARRVAFSPDGRTAYVSISGTQNTFDRQIAVLDAATATPRNSITGPVDPFGLLVSPDGRSLYVAGSGTDTDYAGALVSFDLSSLVPRPLTDGYSQPILAGPTNIALSGDGSTLFASNPGTTDKPSTSVLVIDTATSILRGTAQVGGSAFDVAVAPDDRFAYVSTSQGLQVVGLS